GRSATRRSIAARRRRTAFARRSVCRALAGRSPGPLRILGAKARGAYTAGVLALALVLLSSHAGEKYAEMRQQTFERGRELEFVMRLMLPDLIKRFDECVLIAAPNDQDWEADYF